LLTFNKYTIVLGPIVIFTLLINRYLDEIKRTDINKLLKDKSIWKWSWYITVYALISQWVANEITQHGLNIKPPDINFAYTIVAAPIVSVMFSSVIEEVIFRKIIFTYLDKKFNFYIAAIISSALFALGHYNYAGWLGYFVLGLFWCWIYKKTGNITISILSHTYYNLFSFIMLTVR
jgi:membrane protease YdiL (CAAX protease family)